MKLKSLHIKNFKSIVDLEIVEPNPFTVFVGPNGSGKSNIFEALEFMKYVNYGDYEIVRTFGGQDSLANRAVNDFQFIFTIKINDLVHEITNDYRKFKEFQLGMRPYDEAILDLFNNWGEFSQSFSRIFTKNKEKEFKKFEDSFKLSFSASNLEKVLKRILQDEVKREEILEILQLLVPELENIEVYSDNISGQDTLLIKEKNTSKPFGKSLISDGTYNILCLLTAIYQSDEPQFLCIEEPENGLSPYAIELLVELMRNKCEEKGHYIWLNTHSPTLVRQLRANELILVDKKDGATQIKQFEGKNFHGLSMDEAWLTNALGGGLPW